MKGKFTLFLTFFLCTAIYAQELPRIAVYATGRRDAAENRMVANQITHALVSSGQFMTIERADAFIEQVDREHVTQRSGAIDDRQISRLGRRAGAQFVCIVEIIQAFGGHQMSARIVNVETVAITHSGIALGELRNLNDFRNLSQEVVRTLLGGSQQTQQTQQRQQHTTPGRGNITASSIAGTWHNTDGSQEAYTFNANGTGTWIYGGDQHQFTFTINGNTVKRTIYGSVASRNLDFASHGNSFTDFVGDTFTRSAPLRQQASTPPPPAQTTSPTRTPPTHNQHRSAPTTSTLDGMMIFGIGGAYSSMAYVDSVYYSNGAFILGVEIEGRHRYNLFRLGFNFDLGFVGISNATLKEKYSDKIYECLWSSPCSDPYWENYILAVGLMSNAGVYLKVDPLDFIYILAGIGYGWYGGYKGYIEDNGLIGGGNNTLAPIISLGTGIWLRDDDFGIGIDLRYNLLQKSLISFDNFSRGRRGYYTFKISMGFGY